MSQCDVGDFQTRGGFGQKFVTRFARGHFEREPPAAGDLLDIGAAIDDWHAEFFCLARDEAFIGIAAAAAQLMIQMRDGELPFVFLSKFVKNVEQNHGIHAAGNRDQNLLAAPEKSMRMDGLIGLLRQVAHVAMLIHRDAGAR